MLCRLTPSPPPPHTHTKHTAVYNGPAFLTEGCVGYSPPPLRHTHTAVYTSPPPPHTHTTVQSMPCAGYLPPLHTHTYSCLPITNSRLGYYLPPPHTHTHLFTTCIGGMAPTVARGLCKLLPSHLLPPHPHYCCLQQAVDSRLCRSPSLPNPHTLLFTPPTLQPCAGPPSHTHTHTTVYPSLTASSAVKEP